MKEKTKSIKILLVSGALVALFVLSAFALVGCGSASISTLSDSFEAMQTQVETLKTNGIFKQDSSTLGFETEYLVNYGTEVNAFAATAYEEYSVLRTLYNPMFALAMEYVDSTEEYALWLIEQDDLTTSGKNAILALSSSINSFCDELEYFVSARVVLVEHFASSTASGSSSEVTNLMAVNQFKKKYGSLVESAVDMAVCAAQVLEKTNSLNSGQTSATSGDFASLQNYVTVQVLNIFCDVLLTETTNQFSWSSVSGEDADKARLENLADAYESQFADFVNNFASAATSFVFEGTSKTSQEELDNAYAAAYAAVVNFQAEIESFNTALSGLNFSKLTSSAYNCDLSEYVKNYEFAEVYLEKLEQFEAYSLPNYISYISSTLNLA